MRHTIASLSPEVLAMPRELIRDGLLFALAQRYKEDPSHFLRLSKQSMDIAISEQAVCGPGFSTNTLNILLGKPDGSYQPEQAITAGKSHRANALRTR